MYINYSLISQFQPRWLSKDFPSPFCTLQDIAAAATKDVHDNRGMPNFHFDVKISVATIKSEQVSLTDLPHLYSNLLKKAQQTLLHLTHGINMDQDLISHLQDTMRNDTVDYSIFTKHKSYYQEEGRKISQYFVNKGSPFYVIRFDKKIIWNLRQLKTWMEQADDLNKLLLLLYHISSGQPGRGTEVLCMTYCNMDGPTGLRNLYWTACGLAFVSSYNKVSDFNKIYDQLLTYLFRSIILQIRKL